MTTAVSLVVLAVSTHAISPLDPARFEQLLQMQERLLLGAVDETALADRICQGTALVVGASSVRLLAPRADGGVALCGSYATNGAHPLGTVLDATDAALVQQALAERRPVVAIDDSGAGVLTLPVDAETRRFAMQLRPFGGSGAAPERVGLARCAAALAAVALRRSAERPAPKEPEATDVLASLSHDLRQPLNVMLGYTQLLIDDTYGPCNAEQREVLTTIERHARELHVVLTGALELVRLESHAAPARAEPFAVDEVVRDLCTGSLKDRAGPGVALTWYVDATTPLLHGDRFRLRQLLQNLVDNALRHTERGEVSVSAVPHEGAIRLQVTDTGVGIAADDLPHVFAPFRTGSRGRTGTGLGLYIVRRFCESLGGRISVASTPGTGTRFTIDLPVRAPAR
jgi:signal transduction histidine kinase